MLRTTLDLVITTGSGISKDNTVDIQNILMVMAKMVMRVIDRQLIAIQIRNIQAVINNNCFGLMHT